MVSRKKRMKASDTTLFKEVVHSVKWGDIKKDSLYNILEQLNWPFIFYQALTKNINQSWDIWFMVNKKNKVWIGNETQWSHMFCFTVRACMQIASESIENRWARPQRQTFHLHLIRCRSLDWWCRFSVQEIAPEQLAVCVVIERPRHPSLYRKSMKINVVTTFSDSYHDTARLFRLRLFSDLNGNTQLALQPWESLC